MTKFPILIITLACCLFSEGASSQEKHVPEFNEKDVIGVYARVFFGRDNKPVATPDVEFTADGKFFVSGVKTSAKWAVKSNKVVVVMADERYGIAELEPEGMNRLVGVNTHKNGDHFKWVLTRKEPANAQSPKGEVTQKEPKAAKKKGEGKS